MIFTATGDEMMMPENTRTFWRKLSIITEHRTFLRYFISKKSSILEKRINLNFLNAYIFI